MILSLSLICTTYKKLELILNVVDIFSVSIATTSVETDLNKCLPKNLQYPTIPEST